VYTQDDLVQRLGQWIEFNTPWGKRYRGLIEDVQVDSVLIRMPSNYEKEFVSYSRFDNSEFQLAGYDGCAPGPCWWRHGSWFWCWMPIVVIVFFIPWFWW